jgi:hypothetical protein
LGALAQHLTALGCRLIVVEDPYVDRDFLEDYSAYYVKSFPEYPRYCRRLHFFAHPITEDTIKKFLDTDGKDIATSLQSSYLGFTVLRPLPGTFVGRTCLKPKPNSATQLHDMFLRPYEANLAGHVFKVNSLAFQEQDKAVAACATSAVWSSLHKVGHMFGVKVPTPSEITKLAMRDGPRRGLPSDGLTVDEINQAIRRSGLEVEVREQIDDMKALAHGYGQYGIPLILGLRLFEVDPSKPEESPKRLGMHAVTVTGFSTTNTGPMGASFSDRINGLYFHDDQAGPFCHGKLERRIEVNPDTEEPAILWVLDTDFPPRTAGNKVIGHIRTVTIPVDEMVRIQFEAADQMAKEFCDILLPLLPADASLEVDIRLTDVNSTRAAVGHAIKGAHRNRFLQRNLPRFMWRVTGRINGTAVFDLILDATDIYRSFFVTDLIVYDEKLRKAIEDYVDVDANRAEVEEYSEWGAEWLDLLDEL